MYVPDSSTNYVPEHRNCVSGQKQSSSSPSRIKFDNNYKTCGKELERFRQRFPDYMFNHSFLSNSRVTANIPRRRYYNKSPEESETDSDPEHSYIHNKSRGKMIDRKIMKGRSHAPQVRKSISRRNREIFK